ncbi:hypothetical protein V2J09_023977 [Rumex salicifolius]
MAAQNQGPGMDQFDAYFRRADLDRDGRISGAEAVSFFQGSGLSKQVLAQIWMHADQNRIGFLGRQEFYNALKLITVAQSKRDLTPDIVKAALYGPASSKIPPPQINAPPAPAGQLTSLAPTAQMAATPPTVPQNLGPRGPIPPSNSMSQLQNPVQANPLMRPPSVTQFTPVSTASRPPQSTPVLPNAGISTDWLGGRAVGFTAGPTSQIPNRGAAPLVSSPLPITQNLQPAPSHSIARDPKASISGNGFASNSSFGGDLFSSLQPKQNSSSTTSSAVVSSALVPSPHLPQSSPMQSSVQPLQNAFTQQHTGSQLMQSQTLINKPQQPQTGFNLSQAVSQATSAVVSPANASGLGSSTPSQSQAPWPKMTASGIQKYSKLFIDVDTDRDGKITGEQARNLFLSWKLPREVLKQVWDLAEQDNDSMLSLREFCVALYLMERHREGRTLPASLPNSIMFDETLMRMAGLPNSNYNNTAAGVAPGFRQVHGASGSQQMPSAGAVRPPVPVAAHHAEGLRQFNQNKSSPLQLDNSQANQYGQMDQQAEQSDSQDPEKKVEKVENIYLDSREKLEYYRTKMQDLVLYKSRCDNRLNEIIERASADKREAEMVGKKYEEKYKQVAELASKLTIEEATFREYQERKTELNQAIINMEQGGSADGILQVRADRTQSELEELMKALAERCKKHGIEIKSAAMIELPQGWQPGIPEGAVVWDEEWDKFEDEGLVFDKDLKADTQNGRTVSNSGSASYLDDMYPIDDGFSHDSMSHADVNSEKHSSRSEHVFDSESGYPQSEDGSARSPQGSPAHPASEFSDVFARTSEADSDFHRGFDDQGWGTFDGNDDVDSVWGFNANSKDSGHERDGVFDSGGFGLSSIRTDSSSPQARGSNFNNKSSVFADSVPGTPFSKSANSPRYSEAGDSFFNNNYSGFDSFSNQDSHFSPPRETFTRFDSISSSKGESTFGRFDSMNSSHGEAFGRFDSMSSSRGIDHSRGFNSFDDADPFGSSGPFQVSSESKTPKKSSDSWRMSMSGNREGICHNLAEKEQKLILTVPAKFNHRKPSSASKVSKIHTINSKVREN